MTVEQDTILGSKNLGQNLGNDVDLLGQRNNLVANFVNPKYVYQQNMQPPKFSLEKIRDKFNLKIQSQHDKVSS